MDQEEMFSRTQHRLTHYLEQLTKEELKEFQLLLSEKEPGESSSTVTQNQSEEASGVEVASSLVAQYGEQQAWDLALRFWEQMGLKQLCTKAREQMDLMSRDPSSLFHQAFQSLSLSDHESPGQESPSPLISTAVAGAEETPPQVDIKQRNVTKNLECQSLTMFQPTIWESECVLQEFKYLLLLQKLHSRRQGPPDRKSWDMIPGRYLIGIEDLFGSYLDAQEEPQIVILHGAAGIGKSTLVRQVRRAWKEGQLFMDRFQHVFYFNSRELAQCKLLSLNQLISKDNAAPTVPMEQIMFQPEKLLFILDGVDEPEWVLEDQNPELCVHWSQQQPVHALLGSLLGRSTLPEASLLITTRTANLQKLIPSLGQSHWVEVLGFSESGRKEYFYKYFSEESQAIKSFSLVKSNPVLLSLCLVPWVSWLVCTCLKQQMDRGEDLSLTSKTTTALCLHYLSQALPAQPLKTELMGLCSLAAEGICQRKTLFNSGDLSEQGLDEAVISNFLKMGVLKKHPSSPLYSFTHLCLQEFFSSMSWALAFLKDRKDSFESSRIVERLLQVYEPSELFEAPALRFLFGLLSEQGVGEMEKIFNCHLSLKRRRELLLRTKAEAQAKQLYSLGFLYCMYETQDKDFLNQVMLDFQGPCAYVMAVTGYPVLHTNMKSLVVKTDVDLLMITFCLKYCRHVKTLKVIVGEGVQQVRSSVVPYKWTPWTDASWEILFSISGVIQNLEELDLTGNPLSLLALQLLCETLRHPDCHLKTLRLAICSIISSYCQYLALVLSTSTSLTELDLRMNDLGDHSVRLLCEGLRHPACRLRLLWLDQNHLSDQMRMELRGLKSKKPNLKIKQLRLDQNRLSDQVWMKLKGLKSKKYKLKISSQFSLCGLTPRCEKIRIHHSKVLKQPIRINPYISPGKKSGNQTITRKLRAMISTRKHVEVLSDNMTSPEQLKLQSDGGELQAEHSRSLHVLPTASVESRPPETLRTEDGFQSSTGPVATEVVDKDKNLYRVHFPLAGSYHWPNTGLCFVVRKAVTIEIEFCAWCQFLGKIPLQHSHTVVGPLFDIRAEEGAVAAVHLPHFVVLQDGIVDTSLFEVAHFKQEGMILEKPSKVEQCCIVLENPKFSPMGVLLRMIPAARRFIPITCTTLLYYHLHDNGVTFHLYLIPNDCTIRKAIDEEEMKFQFVRTHKPPPVDPLYIGSRYIVSGSKKMEIIPEELELCYRSPGEAQLFSEIYVPHLDSGIKLKVTDKKRQILVWQAFLKPEDFRPTSVLNFPTPKDVHFVDQFREQLVARVTSVDILLDKLHGLVLSEEEYEKVRAEVTNQDKMRRLFSFCPSWSRKDKDLLYQSLKETHPHLIMDLLEEWGQGSWRDPNTLSAEI